MTLRVHTADGAVIRGYVVNSLDAVRVLRELTQKGVTCVRWEIEKE